MLVLPALLPCNIGSLYVVGDSEVGWGEVRDVNDEPKEERYESNVDRFVFISFRERLR
jgi:hypothetical protein